MKRSTYYLIGAAIVLLLLGLGYYYSRMTRNQAGEQQQTQQNDTAQNEQKVRTTVEDFGRALKNVNLLASDVGQQMDDNYGNLVTQELLGSWKNNPQDAPGRLTSSPWPDRIDISSVDRMTDDSYRVNGKVLEVTNADQGGNPTDTRDISLIVNRYGDKWLISDVNMAAGNGASQGDTASATTNGIEFRYPRNLATEYIGTQTWPPTLRATTENYSCQRTGDEETNNGRTVTQKVMNGRVYCITSRNEAAAGTAYTTYTYATPKNGRMLMIDFALKFPQCDNYDDQRRTACTRERQDFNLDAIVDEIAQSAKWDMSNDQSDAAQLQECLPKSDNQSKQTCDRILSGINDFSECVMAGFTVTSGNPNTCALPNGRSFRQS